MKKRNGFVSNSSSASFIVKWKWKEDYGPEENVLANTVLNMFAPYHKFEDESFVTLNYLKSEEIDFDKFYDWEEENGKERLEKIRHLINQTVETEEGFTTTFWTCMYNENNDFGELAKELMFNMLISKRFEYSCQVKSD